MRRATPVGGSTSTAIVLPSSKVNVPLGTLSSESERSNKSTFVDPGGPAPVQPDPGTRGFALSDPIVAINDAVGHPLAKLAEGPRDRRRGHRHHRRSIVETA